MAGLYTFDLNAATRLSINKSIRCVALDGVKRISTDVLLKLLINTNITLIDLNQLQEITKGKLEFKKINKKIGLDFYAMEQVDAVAGSFFSKLNKDTLLSLNSIKLETVEEANFLFSKSSCYIELDGVKSVSKEIKLLISKYKGGVNLQSLN
jgi:hypothetical protein